MAHIKLSPQRFRYTRTGCRDWLYGVAAELYCGSDGYRIRVVFYEIDQLDNGQEFDCCDCDGDPMPKIRERIGDMSTFEWIDKDGGWSNE